MRRLGELEEAEAHLHRTKEIHSNGEDWRGLTAQVHLAEGIVTTAEKKWQEAEEAFKKALEIHRQYPFPYYEAKCRTPLRIATLREERSPWIFLTAS